jgi:hypothetical protein
MSKLKRLFITIRTFNLTKKKKNINYKHFSSTEDTLFYIEKFFSDEMYSDSLTNSTFDYEKYLQNKKNKYFHALDILETCNIHRLIALREYLEDLQRSTSEPDLLSSLKDYSKKINHIMNIKTAKVSDTQKNMYRRIMSYGFLYPNNVGRLYTPIASLASLPKEIRSLLFKDYYINVDLVNSHVSILYHFAESNSLNNESLKKFLINHQELMEHLYAQLKLKNLAEAKKMVLQVVNFKHYSGKSPFLKEFFEDILIIREKIYDSFPLEKPLLMKHFMKDKAYQAKSLEEKK